MRAAKGLGTMALEANEAGPALLPLLRDPERDVRMAAAAALKKIRPEEAPASGCSPPG